MNNVGYYNGEYGPIEEMRIPMNDRAVYFGDGVYEAVLVKNRVIFSLEEHLDRFWRSFSALRIPFAMSREQLRTELYKMVDLLDTDDPLVLYWQASRGTASRTHTFPKEGKANLMITVKPFVMKDMKTFRHRLLTVEDTRFFHCDVKTLNLIPNVMAAQQAEEAGCTEAVFHRGERVTEGAHSNVSILKDGVLKTAPLDHLILPGITRMHLLQLAGQCGIPVLEEPFTLEELKEADEVLVTSSTALCLKAETIDGAPVRMSAPELVEKLQEAYRQKFERETDPALRKS
mgnify:FL=1